MKRRSHYTGDGGRSYFEVRARRRARDAQIESARLFLPFVERTDTVLDFGCGTGGILASLPCARRVGIEVNEPSRGVARANGIEVHSELSAIPDESVDLVITHHALEHVHDPLSVLRRLLRVVREGGRLIAVVPAESPTDPAQPLADPDRHLFSWTPKTLANLVHEAGFDVKRCYRAQGGYSRYIAWLRPFPALLHLAEHGVAFALRRYQNVCLAEKPHREISGAGTP
jgi:SAM-dependent methyltransferase